MNRTLALLLLLAPALFPQSSQAGAYVFAGAASLDEVTHARVYTGTGGTLPALTICIDISVNPALAAQAEGSVIKAVSTYNRLRSIPNNNFALNASTDIPVSQVDFESTLLHEMGHCQGLAHPNHATESGIAEPGRNGTKSDVGANTIFDQNAGADTRHGSSDDVRGDDVNLHWYIRNQNNPGQLPGLFDTSTLIRALTALPGGHLFAANADRDVMNALGFANTEAVMQQGAFTREAQRHMQHDDVTTMRLARAGLDRVQGNSDDYIYSLQYVGQLSNPTSAACNLRVRVDASTGFAVCSVGGVGISADNVRVTTANLAFNDATAWYFTPSENTVTQITSDAPDPSVPGQTYTAQVTVTEAGAGTAITGQPSGTVEVSNGVGGLCTITLVGSVGEVGSCNLSSGAPATLNLSARYLGFAGWDSSAGTTTHIINKANTTLSIVDAPDPAPQGSNVTVTATLNVVAPGTGTPTGTITVTATNSAGCTITLPSTSCVLTFTASGAQTINASYGGNTNFNGSSATAIGHQSDSNTPPTITAIADLAINEDQNTGALAFTVGDAQTPVGSLTLSAASTNLALVPLANIVFGGSGASRNVTVTPLANQSGVATITVTVTDANSATANEAFLLTVNALNDLPTITAIADLAINEDANTGAIAFTVGDVETTVASLTLSAASSNLTLVPVANIVFGGSGASRTVTVTPVVNQFGVANITVTVTDGNSGTANEVFQLTVNAQNDLPTITAIADLAINEDANTGAIAFTVGDVETAVASLTLSAASSNLTLVPVANIVFGGSGASRTVTVTPVANQFGVANITVTVTDANSGTANEAFLLTVNALNDLPTITAIADLAINEDANTGALAFTVGDVETAAASLTLSAASSNLTLVPVANIVFGGSGASRNVTATPLANQFGVANITITVTDANSGTAIEAFQLTVNAQNDVPTVSSPGNQVINEDANTGALNVTVGDVETAAASLVLTASSSNTTLIPNGTIVLAGSGVSRTVQATPVANLSGSATITLTVTDAGTAIGTATFDVNVNPVNDAPSFTVLGTQSPVAGTFGVQTASGFVTAVNLGPSESGQAVAEYVVAEISDPNGIVSAASLSNAGTLSYTLTGSGGTADPRRNATRQWRHREWRRRHVGAAAIHHHRYCNGEYFRHQDQQSVRAFRKWQHAVHD